MGLKSPSATLAANQRPRLTVTAAELMELSTEGRLELVCGEVIERASTVFEHGHIAAILTSLMYQHMDSRGLGKVVTGDGGFYMERNPDTVRAPDIA